MPHGIVVFACDLHRTVKEIIEKGFSRPIEAQATFFGFIIVRLKGAPEFSDYNAV